MKVFHLIRGYETLKTIYKSVVDVFILLYLCNLLLIIIILTHAKHAENNHLFKYNLKLSYLSKNNFPELDLFSYTFYLKKTTYIEFSTSTKRRICSSLHFFLCLVILLYFILLFSHCCSAQLNRTGLRSSSSSSFSSRSLGVPHSCGASFHARRVQVNGRIRFGPVDVNHS